MFKVRFIPVGLGLLLVTCLPAVGQERRGPLERARPGMKGAVPEIGRSPSGKHYEAAMRFASLVELTGWRSVRKAIGDVDLSKISSVREDYRLAQSASGLLQSLPATDQRGRF